MEYIKPPQNRSRVVDSIAWKKSLVEMYRGTCQTDHKSKGYQNELQLDAQGGQIHKH